MPISYQNQTFHLKTNTSSYVMEVLPSGHLAHLYWGAPIREAQVSHLLILWDRAFSPNLAPEFPSISLDLIPQEFPSYGTSDFRSPIVEIQQTNGSTAGEFLYKSHRISDGKPKLEGLPATYVEADSEAQTLEIELYDAVSGALATLSYTVFEELGAITRSVKIENKGEETFKIKRVLSVSLDFPSADYEFLHLAGSWARERDVYRSPLRRGTQSIESRRGSSSHQHNPFFALLSPDATENSGEVFGFNLVYSGSFLADVEVDQYDSARAQIGINPFDFEWVLTAGESFQAPEAVMVYSANGLGEMSRTFHKLFRTRLCRGYWRDKVRPVLINSWEASYFNIDEETIMKLGRTAKDAGVELLVMDDGWFGKRDNDRTSLGDWIVHPTKFPHGLQPLAQKINDLGMAFGLWFEPEMISPDSDLYRTHPDWCLHVPERRRTQARQQLILDLSREDVCDYLIEVVGEILSSVSIGYVKWDMNRNMTEIGSAHLPAERQRETAHRYMLGLYRVLETLTARFPEVLFESCSGGGGRFDAGLLYYMPQVWASDNTDAISRLNIQYGTSIAYPASTIGAHVSDCPNHQVHRTTPFATRGAVAMGGNFGYEFDLNTISEAQRQAVAKQVAFYKEIRQTVQSGDFYRLKSPFEGNDCAWMFASADKREALVSYVEVLAVPNSVPLILRLQGLNSELNYSIRQVDLGEAGHEKIADEIVLGGDVLMNVGFRLTGLDGDFASRTWHLKAV